MVYRNYGIRGGRLSNAFMYDFLVVFTKSHK